MLVKHLNCENFDVDNNINKVETAKKGPLKFKNSWLIELKCKCWIVEGGGGVRWVLSKTTIDFSKT